MPDISRKYQLEDLLTTCAEQEASDLHLVVGKHPTLRIDGALVPLIKKDILSPRDTQELAEVILNDEQLEIFRKNFEIDLSYNFKGKARFRVNVYKERGYVAVALRFISTKIRTLSQLNLPPVLEEFTRYSQGLVLVVGPTGQGKSTTLAALIDIINNTRNDHIITIEDPIEYLFEQNHCLINQREVSQDTKSFADALRHIFRQDPDVIMIGEMRDLETISIALTAAETGHLVLTTLHTNSAAQTIDRIIDSFPGHQQPQVRSQLASSLLGIISQRLIPRIDGGLIPAVEILIANPAIRNLIREGKTHEIDLVISTSSAEGMISLDRSLANLIKEGKITLENGEMYALNRKNLKTLLKN